MHVTNLRAYAVPSYSTRAHEATAMHCIRQTTTIKYMLQPLCLPFDSTPTKVFVLKTARTGCGWRCSRRGMIDMHTCVLCYLQAEVGQGPSVGISGQQCHRSQVTDRIVCCICLFVSMTALPRHGVHAGQQLVFASLSHPAVGL